MPFRKSKLPKAMCFEFSAADCKRWRKKWQSFAVTLRKMARAAFSTQQSALSSQPGTDSPKFHVIPTSEREEEPADPPGHLWPPGPAEPALSLPKGSSSFALLSSRNDSKFD
jgi:hypothetical protein